MYSKQLPIVVIGAGLAGSEASWQLANAGVAVHLYEMRPEKKSPAHKTENYAELVCSNSFRSDDKYASAIGLLHEEMRQCNSLIMKCADDCALPAGNALAVDREIFSKKVTEKINSHPLITVFNQEVTDLDSFKDKKVIIATGPLTSDALAEYIKRVTGESELAFFDAIAPVIEKESINTDKAWFQSRYDKTGIHGTGKDYINCPLEKEEYECFITELLESEKIEFKDWEKNTPYFEGCMPVEVMASRGIDTLRFGPMKPVGLTDPRTGKRPYAVVQLRQDNALGTLYNMVGFQTKMKYGEQMRVFRMIPGLENAVFAKLGGMHRNTFINSPKLLDSTLRLRSNHNIRFAGQITGCEGYVESACVGLMAGRFTIDELQNNELIKSPPQTTAMGSLLTHITSNADESNFQPMNINFGLFPPIERKSIENHEDYAKPSRKKLKGAEKKQLICERALEDIKNWV